jgi:hypothetical protein
MNLIEIAFEGDDSVVDNEDNKLKDVYRALQFNDGVGDETLRLRRICENIVKNGGRFALEDVPLDKDEYDFWLEELGLEDDDE